MPYLKWRTATTANKAKTMISLRTILLTLIALVGTFTAYAVSADDCDVFAVRAYEIQLDRQYGIKTDWQPETAIEWDMANNVWQHPQFRSERNKVKRARLFADDWKRACIVGWYE